MLHAPEKLHTITHPLVSSIYLRKDFDRRNGHPEDVLVIKTSFSDPDYDYETFDSYLVDLLLDLETLKKQAETCIGPFDRIDICTT